MLRFGENLGVRLHRAMRGLSLFGATLARLLQIVWILIRCGLSAGLPTRLARALRLPVLVRGERLRGLFEELGGTFIKFGQMLALQPDLLPLETCNSLFKLLDRVAPFGAHEVDTIFQQELALSPGDVFTAFESEPLATASIGQVHRATTAQVSQDGTPHFQKWAVKVQRPGAQREFEGDICLMNMALRVITTLKLSSFYWVVEPIREFVDWTREELDYRYEARHLQRFSEQTRDSETARVPAVWPAFTTRRTLVAEFLEGVTLLDYLRALEATDQDTLQRVTELGFEPERFACHIIDNFLGDAFRYGNFHADLHPANLMILKGNVVGYVDFGITGVLGEYSRQRLVRMTLAYTRGDLDGLCEHFFGVSEFGRGADPEAFRQQLEEAASSWYTGPANRRKPAKNFTLVMLEMLTISRAAGIWPERDVVKYIRSAIALDGLIHRFAPDFELGPYLGDACARFLRWQDLADGFSAQRIENLADAGLKLLSGGPSQAVTLLDQALSGQLVMEARLLPNAEARRELRFRTWLQAAVFATLALASYLLGKPAQFAFDPPTTVLILLSLASILLFASLWRMARTMFQKEMSSVPTLSIRQ